MTTRREYGEITAPNPTNNPTQTELADMNKLVNRAADTAGGTIEGGYTCTENSNGGYTYRWTMYRDHEDNTA